MAHRHKSVRLDKYHQKKKSRIKGNLEIRKLARQESENKQA